MIAHQEPGNQELSGFFDVEEVNFFGKVVCCVKTVIFVFFYLKINDATNAVMNLLKDDVKDEMNLSFEIGELLQTMMLPAVSADIVITIVTLIKSKRYNALNFFLRNSAVVYGVYRGVTKHGLISSIKEAL